MHRDFVQEALTELGTRIVDYLPTLLTGLLLLLAGWALAWLGGSLLRRLARRLGLDAAAERSGLAERLARARVKRPVSGLLGSFLFWLLFLVSAVVALDTLGFELSSLPIQVLFAYLPRVLGALLLIVAGALGVQVAGRAAEAGAAGLGIEFHRGLGQAVRGLLLVVVGVLAISQLGFDVTLLSGTLTSLITIVAGGLVLCLAIGGRSVAENLLAGYYAKEQLTLGEEIELDGERGTLESIGTVNAEILTPRERLLVPNVRLVQSTLRVPLAAPGPPAGASRADD